MIRDAIDYRRGGEGGGGGGGRWGNGGVDTGWGGMNVISDTIHGSKFPLGNIRPPSLSSSRL